MLSGSTAQLVRDQIVLVYALCATRFPSLFFKSQSKIGYLIPEIGYYLIVENSALLSCSQVLNQQSAHRSSGKQKLQYM